MGQENYDILPVEISDDLSEVQAEPQTLSEKYFCRKRSREHGLEQICYLNVHKNLEPSAKHWIVLKIERYNLRLYLYKSVLKFYMFLPRPFPLERTWSTYCN